jgi:hypothetical protein
LSGGDRNSQQLTHAVSVDADDSLDVDLSVFPPRSDERSGRLLELIDAGEITCLPTARRLDQRDLIQTDSPAALKQAAGLDRFECEGSLPAGTCESSQRGGDMGLPHARIGARHEVLTHDEI